MDEDRENVYINRLILLTRKYDAYVFSRDACANTLAHTPFIKHINKNVFLFD